MISIKKLTIPWVNFQKNGASKQIRTAVSTLARSHTNHCTIPAHLNITKNSKKNQGKIANFRDLLYNWFSKKVVYERKGKSTNK